MNRLGQYLENINITDLKYKLDQRDPELVQLMITEINPVLLKVLYTHKIDRQSCQDIIHQTWQRFFENYEAFEGRSQLSTFIIGLLINKIREFRRAQKRLVLEDDSEAIFKQTFADGWWVNEPTSPDRLLEQKNISTQIEDCLEGLTEQQRAAFILREVEEEESDDICNVLGVNVSHLRVLLFRAKDKLKKCLEGQIL